MRPQQQNRRMRGRNNSGGGNNSNNSNNNNNASSHNNNRRGPNPLNRSYESNGPDVKIRGSAQQIAEKYTTLARDSQSSGDRVMAENYLQHAEHYNRIVAAIQAQMPQPVQRDQRQDFDEEGGDERDEFDQRQGGYSQSSNSSSSDGNQSGNNDQSDERSSRSRENGPRDDGQGPQPFIEGTPAEVAYSDQQVVSNDGASDRDEQAERERPRRPRRAVPARTPRVASGNDEPIVASEPVVSQPVEQSAAPIIAESVAPEAASESIDVAGSDAEKAPRRRGRPRRVRDGEGDLAPDSGAEAEPAAS